MRLLRCVLLASPACFTGLGSSKMLQTAVGKPVGFHHVPLLPIFTNPRKCNMRPLEDDQTIAHGQESAKSEYLASIFDRTLSTIDHRTGALAALKLTDDHSWMIQRCLEWCSDPTTSDRSRVYGAASFIRSWSQYGVQVEGHLLDLLDYSGDYSTYSAAAICKLLSELVFHRLFSVGKYCQRLMANGNFGSKLFFNKVGQDQRPSFTADSDC